MFIVNQDLSSLEEWQNSNPLTKEQHKFIFNKSVYKCSKQFDTVQDEFKCLLLNFNAEKFYVKCSNKARTLISEIIDEYVSKDSLIITSIYEHITTNEKLQSLQNLCDILWLDTIKFDEDSLVDFANYKLCTKKYSNAIVIISGTSVYSLNTVKNSLFIKLKNSINKNGSEAILILDDVHGMFMIERDYSIFDYIAFTTHIFTGIYDTGILLEKHKLNRKNEDSTLLQNAIDRIKIILPCKFHMQKFCDSALKCISCNEVEKNLIDSAFAIKDYSIQNINKIRYYIDNRRTELFYDSHINLQHRICIKSNVFYTFYYNKVVECFQNLRQIGIECGLNFNY